MKETFEDYLQRLKDRRTEDSYKYTDEDFTQYEEYIRDCCKSGMSVYKCLEFMYFAEKEIKLEDVFNDEKKEIVIKVIQEHKQETVEEYFLDNIKNVLLFKNDAQAIRFMEKYYHAKKEEEQDNTANEILDYILTNDDGVGIALGYNSREMIEQYFKRIGYERLSKLVDRTSKM
jgi:hypothetical protein